MLMNNYRGKLLKKLNMIVPRKHATKVRIEDPHQFTSCLTQNWPIGQNQTTSV